MKRWGGLLRREWALMKWFTIALLITNLGITVISNSHIFLGVSDDLDAYLFIGSGLWFSLHTYMGIVLIAVSYDREKSGLDIWLHSPVPYMQLIGAKVVVAVLSVACSLSLTGIVITIFNYAGGYWNGVSILTEILLIVAMISIIVLNTTLFIMFTLFFLQVYQVLKSRVGGFSIFVTIVLLNMSAVVWAVIYFMDWFQGMKEMGPIYGIRTATEVIPNVYETNFILAGPVPESAILTIGSVLLYGIFISILFISGAVLFEKKVRL